MAPKTKSKSAGVKKSSSTTRAYGSKLCASLLDETLIPAALGKLKKNAKTTGKWVAKMRASVLRKISANTKTAFAAQGEDSFAARQAEIEKLRETIRKQTASIAEAATQMYQKSNLAEAHKAAKKEEKESSSSGSSNGRFSARVASISEKFKQVALQLDTTTKDMNSRIASMSSCVTNIEGSWEQTASAVMTRRGKIKAAAAAAASSSSPRGGGRGGGGSGGGGGGAKVNALGALNEYLEAP